MTPLSTERSEKHLERCRQDFARTANPLFVFEGWGVWRVLNKQLKSNGQTEAPLPEWVVEYFDECGRRLLGKEPKTVKSGNTTYLVPWSEERQSVARAMGFAGEIQAARVRWGGEFDANEMLALKVVHLMESERISLNAAAKRLEETHGTTLRTARRAVETAHNYALQRMEDSLEMANWPLETDMPIWKQYSRLCQGLDPVPNAKFPPLSWTRHFD